MREDIEVDEIKMLEEDMVDLVKEHELSDAEFDRIIESITAAARCKPESKPAAKPSEPPSWTPQDRAVVGKCPHCRNAFARDRGFTGATTCGFCDGAFIIQDDGKHVFFLPKEQKANQ